MDRGRDSDPDRAMLADLACEIGEALAPPPPRSHTTRATFVGAQFELVRGLVVYRMSGVGLARLAPCLRLHRARRAHQPRRSR